MRPSRTARVPQFNVKVLETRRLGVADSAFKPADYRAMLEAAEYPDAAETPEDELRDMLILVLQDLQPSAAAAIVLKHHLGDRMTRGQWQNLAYELGNEKHWEHYADMGLHEGIFHASSLMWSAFPGDYPTPDAVGLTVEVLPSNDEAKGLLESGVEEPLLVRLLADGLPANAMLHRLFDEQLAGAPFPQASSIAWAQSCAVEGEGVRIEVTGSNGWLGGLRRGDSWVSDGKPDVPEPAED